MPALLVSSLRPLVGKTTVAVGLAQRLQQDRRPLSLTRLAPAEPDEAAQADARCFASLSLSPHAKASPLSLADAAELTRTLRDTALIMELPAGFPIAEAARTLEGTVILVERFASLNAGDVSSLQRELGAAFAGLVLTAVPRPRLAAIAATLADKALPHLALLPEDKLLASPSIAEMAAALEAQTLYADSRSQEVVERLTIAPISADPGQDYFLRFGRQAVVVRYNKPDLQLAALNTASQCLVLTGGQMPLAYVSERAQAEGVPLLITGKDTVAALQALEELYFNSRFGGPQKAERISQLVAEYPDFGGLLKTLSP